MDVRASSKRRVALVGTGHRGTGDVGAGAARRMRRVGRDGGLVRHATRCASQRARELIGIDAPLFTDLAAMLREVRPETVIVCSRDCDARRPHRRSARGRLRRRHREADDDDGREVPPHARGRGAHRAPASTSPSTTATRRPRGGSRSCCCPARSARSRRSTSTGISTPSTVPTTSAAGTPTRESSGSLFVHKATHHFDLLNWYLESEPAEVFARGELRNYGANGPFRGIRCRTCPHAPICDYHFDIGKESAARAALRGAVGRQTATVRDACVFREDIDIPDTMSAAIGYANGVQVVLLAQHLHADRGLPSRLQRPAGAHRDPPARAPALGSARPRRDPA